MKIRGVFASIVLASLFAGSACGHGPGGKLPADTMQYNVKTKAWEPLLTYKAPDIDEITGIDSSEPDDAAK